MIGQAKLELSSARQGRERDVWRVVSDLFGGALSFAVWFALWAWMAAAVVGPLSGVVASAGAARTPSAPSLTAPFAGSGT
jgi:hypothetical protein